MWCDDASKAVNLQYSEIWDGASTFFTERVDFAVGGVSTWRTLTGGDNREWAYLLETRTKAYGKPRYTGKVSGVSIDGVTRKGLFIYPDDYNGSEVGNGGPGTWTDINSAGLVFLPAAGLRLGCNGKTTVQRVGNDCYYWSGFYSLPNIVNTNENACRLNIRPNYVGPSMHGRRSDANSVRLVADY